jgi:hypothetical protein
MFPAIYIKLTKNCLEVINLKTGMHEKRKAIEPFSTERLLVGQFDTAESLLRDLVKRIVKGASFWWILPTDWHSCMIMHPMDLLEGGLSQIEERLLVHLGVMCGASHVIVYLGQELSKVQAWQLVQDTRLRKTYGSTLIQGDA